MSRSEPVDPRGRDSDSRGAHSATVLAFGDDEAFLGRSRTVLEAWGFRVLVTRSPEEIRSLLGAADLVLLDGRIGEDDGCGACRAIRAMSDPFLQVIMVDADASAERTAECLRAGADDLVAKSAAETELVARVHSHLRRRGLELALLAMTPPERMAATIEILGALFRRSGC